MLFKNNYWKVAVSAVEVEGSAGYPLQLGGITTLKSTLQRKQLECVNAAHLELQNDAIFM
jgi:hypothetical protein